MTDKPTQELKPCPFCGGEGAFGETRYSKSHEAWWSDGSQVLHAHFVSCVKCGGSRRGVVGGQQTKDEAIAAWNTRSGDATELLREIENYQVPRDWTTDAWGGGASVKKEILSIVRTHLGEA